MRSVRYHPRTSFLSAPHYPFIASCLTPRPVLPPDLPTSGVDLTLIEPNDRPRKLARAIVKVYFSFVYYRIRCQA
ncbi:hypothetical protein BD779DRAFT_1564022, partial [Infundibulicybe gibba]